MKGAIGCRRPFPDQLPTYATGDEKLWPCDNQPAPKYVSSISGSVTVERSPTNLQHALCSEIQAQCWQPVAFPQPLEPRFHRRLESNQVVLLVRSPETIIAL